MHERVTKLCLNWLLVILCFTTMFMKLFLYMLQLVSEIEQIERQLMRAIHS